MNNDCCSYSNLKKVKNIIYKYNNIKQILYV